MENDNLKDETKPLNKPFVSGSCFWGHRWAKWEQYNAYMISLKDLKTQYQQLRQKRYCVRCNKMEVEDIGY